MTNGRPRRRSIFGGLLLILLGVLFLLHNFRGDFGILGLLWRWWPLLLILWGLAKLYDHFAARRTGQAGPATITGGDIFLVIVVILLVSGVSGIDRVRRGFESDGFRLPWEEHYSFTEEVPAKTVPADARIDIRTDRGDIVVRPEDAAEIRVVVKKTVGGSDEDEARKRAQDVSVVITETGHGYEVRAQGQSEGGRRVEVDFEVHVPKHSSVTAETDRGDVLATGVVGGVNAETRRGDIELRDIGADVSVKVRRGDVHIVGAQGSVRVSGSGGDIEIADIRDGATIEGEFSGTTRVNRVAKGVRFLSQKTDLTLGSLPGQLEIDPGDLIVSDARGDCALVTRNKTIRLENVAGRVQIENRHGDIELTFSKPPQDEINVTNDKADIALLLPPGSSFEVDALTRSGEVENEFEDAGVKSAEDGGNFTLRGKLGAKGPGIRLRTTYGTIRLHKSK